MQGKEEYMKKVFFFIAVMLGALPSVGFCEAYITYRSGECRVDLNGMVTGMMRMLAWS